MSSQIEKLVRDGLLFMLSDATTGFNAQLAAVASIYNIVPYVIDWTGANGNFIQSRVSPADVEASGTIQDIDDPTSSLTYALMTIDTISDSDIGLTMDSIFGGDVQGVIDITLSFEKSEASQNFSDWADASMWAIRKCLSRTDYPQANGTLIYARQWQSAKGPLQFGGGNWRQTISFFPKFKVIAH